MTTKNTYILTLGQLAASQGNNVAVKEFAKIIAKNGIYKYLPNFFSKLKVWSALLLDHLFIHTIDNYKKGLMTDDKFLEKIQEQLGIKNNKENYLINKYTIKAAWLSMCTISNENFLKINEMFEKIKANKNTETKLLVISATNKIQFDYIIDQLKDNCPLFNELVESKKITFVSSFDHGKLELKDLAKIAIEKNKVDVLEPTKKSSIISLHGAINNRKNDLCKNIQLIESFTYNAVDSINKKLPAIPVKANVYHDQGGKDVRKDVQQEQKLDKQKQL